MNKSQLLILLLLFIIINAISCSKENGGGQFSVDCTTVTNKAFAADVDPIIQGRCNLPGCHASGSSNGPGAITNYTQVFNNRVAIRAAIVSDRMPKGSSLSTAQMNSIICWIDSGAPNN